MKILFVATVQSHIAQFHMGNIRILKEHGDVVHVAARDNLSEKNGLQIENADEIFDVPFDRSPFSWCNIKAFKELKKIIERENYDIVHCNTPVGGVVARLAAKKYRKNGTRLIYTAHGFHFYTGAPYKNWIVYYPIEKIMAHLTDKLITVNDEDFNRAKGSFSCPVYRIHGTGIKSGRYDAVTDEQVAVYREKYDCVSKYVILCTGELNSNKNQATVIRAMPTILQSVPNAVLLLAGNGPEHDSLQRLISELSLDNRVILLGYRVDLPVFVHMCDVAVSASIREGLGLNLIEAMYCGKPVVASYNRGHNELVQDGKNGYLVNVHDSEGFAKRIIELVSSRELREKYGRYGHELSIQYTDNAVNQEMAKIYEIR